MKTKTILKNLLIEKSEEHYYKIIADELKGCKTVLDVGCGVNSPLGKIPKTFYLEGVDLVSKNEVSKFHDKFVKKNIMNIYSIYKPNSFDAVVFLNCIEHLKRSDGKKMLEDLEKIAKKKIIISTPNGFLTQDPQPGNPYQEHISGWYVKDFKGKGYRVYGLRGFKALRGEFALVKYKPWYLWLLISYFTQFVLFYFPKHAFELMAVKSKRSS